MLNRDAKGNDQSSLCRARSRPRPWRRSASEATSFGEF